MQQKWRQQLHSRCERCAPCTVAYSASCTACWPALRFRSFMKAALISSSSRLSQTSANAPPARMHSCLPVQKLCDSSLAPVSSAHAQWCLF